jgi:hypothetical protein
MAKTTVLATDLVITALWGDLLLSWGHRPRRCPRLKTGFRPPLSEPAQAPIINGPMSARVTHRRTTREPERTAPAVLPGGSP